MSTQACKITKECRVVLEKWPTINLKSPKINFDTFPIPAKDFSIKDCHQCSVFIEKCPITNLKTARILLEKCPVKDLKTPVLKLKKITMAANSGGKKTLKPTKKASKKKRRCIRVIPKNLTQIRKDRGNGKPSLILKSSKPSNTERTKGESISPIQEKDNNDTGYGSDKENGKFKF